MLGDEQEGVAERGVLGVADGQAAIVHERRSRSQKRAEPREQKGSDAGPWIQVSPISSSRVGRVSRMPSTACANASNVEATILAPGYSFRRRANSATTASREGGPRLSFVWATYRASRSPGAVKASPWAVEPYSPW
ncbi:hypothetical protein GCM10025867_17260 [Frondihabitans sucicola]|uniref:Uncharacterized protein n=1 Tax=Frondihabitans sucicola TaxID=1268041 RepID=A0ABM8GM37_9MICO|nr:hypothetical protein GCM10025867_17260 [Frondihabitans sucicola]